MHRDVGSWMLAHAPASPAQSFHYHVPRITRVRVTCERPRKLLVITFDDFVGWAAHNTVFSVACNSDSDIMAALQETVDHTQRHRLDADKFPMFSVGWISQRFCPNLDPCLFE